MKTNLKRLVTVALLVAIEIVLSRFCSITTPIVRIGFGFAPIAVCGMLYGPVWAGAMAAVSDVTGALMFPTAPYFPGFTLSAALTGAAFGILLRKAQCGIAGIISAVGINCLGISLLLNTYWLTLITGSPFFILLPTRVLQCCIMIPVQFIVVRLLRNPVGVIRRTV